MALAHAVLDMIRGCQCPAERNPDETIRRFCRFVHDAKPARPRPEAKSETSYPEKHPARRTEEHSQQQGLVCRRQHCHRCPYCRKGEMERRKREPFRRPACLSSSLLEPAGTGQVQG